MLEEIKYWALKSVANEDLSYIGNDGYEDELQVKYVYDDTVANHKQIQTGDIAVIVDKEKVLGLAKISRILIFIGKKDRRRCPVCRSTNYEPRKTKTPLYKCNKGHEFNVPDSEVIEVIKFEAYYSDSFKYPIKNVSIDKLRPYYINNYNRNMSMQRLSMDFFKKYFTEELVQLNETFIYPSAEESNRFLSDLFSKNFDPTQNDERVKIFQSIMRRRGQQNFRQSLRNIYGDQCMVTGCEVLDVLEAAHISPYRGDKDHHVSNGLLLRSDIHTLFDLDLVGVEPKKLIVKVNKLITKSEYKELDGYPLKIAYGNRPSEKALNIRWEMFHKGAVI